MNDRRASNRGTLQIINGHRQFDVSHFALRRVHRAWCRFRGGGRRLCRVAPRLSTGRRRLGCCGPERGRLRVGRIHLLRSMARGAKSCRLWVCWNDLWLFARKEGSTQRSGRAQSSQRRKPWALRAKSRKVVGDDAFDLLVAEAVLVALTAVKAVVYRRCALCINHLRGTGLQVCVLLNFGNARRLISGAFSASNILPFVGQRCRRLDVRRQMQRLKERLHLGPPRCSVRRPDQGVAVVAIWRCLE